MGFFTKDDLERLLNEPLYSWDTTTMLGGVVDFLEFSEGNLSWQREREVRKAWDEGASVRFVPRDEQLEGQYRIQLVENAEYQFDVMLSQSIRYSGLTAFVTAIELCGKAFAKALNVTIDPTPEGENEQIHLLAALNRESSSGFDREIRDVRGLLRVRNCIVHAAGFVNRYKYAEEIRQEVETLDGISIWRGNFLGESICISTGAMERYARRATGWVPKLHKQCVAAGVLKGYES